MAIVCASTPLSVGKAMRCIRPLKVEIRGSQPSYRVGANRPQHSPPLGGARQHYAARADVAGAAWASERLTRAK
jgi:hypothetical protein